MITTTSILITFAVLLLLVIVKYCADIHIINKFESLASLELDQRFELEQRRRFLIQRLLAKKD